MNLESIFKFGKYSGQQVEDILEDDPGYITWLCENTQVTFDDDVLEALEKRRKRK